MGKVVCSSVDLDEKWHNKLQEIRDFIEKEGDLDEGLLGKWCFNQRENQGKLSLDQIASLETIPGWYWKRDSDVGLLGKWHNKLQEIRDFIEKEGQL